ncbi:MAG: V-type ATPase subunit, partial [Thermoplasmata archaeon]|nr:V-type ATPase subunit [Thermoplasmata archaeon]
EVVGALEPKYPALPEGNGIYQVSRSLAGYEAALQRERAVRELKRVRTYPLSVAVVFGFLLVSELERSDLRRIVYGKLYGVAPLEIERELIVPKL